MDISRIRLIFEEDAICRLQKAHVAIFGLGGVGSFAAEAIARSGIGEISLIDKDTVDSSNVNRQLVALTDTFGCNKTEVMAQRIQKINPEANVHTYPVFFQQETCGQFSFEKFDYVIDAIDTVSAKLLLVEQCHLVGTPLISCMGTGNKLDPTRFEVADIYDTSVCPLARVMRRELKKRDIPALKVVYSREEPMKIRQNVKLASGKVAPGSLSFVPPVAGMILAGEAIKHIAFGGREV